MQIHFVRFSMSLFCVVLHAQICLFAYKYKVSIMNAFSFLCIASANTTLRCLCSQLLIHKIMEGLFRKYVEKEYYSSS